VAGGGPGLAARVPSRHGDVVYCFFVFQIYNPRHTFLKIVFHLVITRDTQVRAVLDLVVMRDATCETRPTHVSFLFLGASLNLLFHVVLLQYLRQAHNLLDHVTHFIFTHRRRRISDIYCFKSALAASMYRMVRFNASLSSLARCNDTKRMNFIAQFMQMYS
jgi:hypothetical protein